MKRAEIDTELELKQTELRQEIDKKKLENDNATSFNVTQPVKEKEKFDLIKKRVILVVP